MPHTAGKDDNDLAWVDNGAVVDERQWNVNVFTIYFIVRLTHMPTEL